MQATYKQDKRAVVVAMILLGACAAPLHAADSSIFTVNATVMDNCTIATTALDFGSYDPIDANSGSDLLSTSTLTVQCTLDTAATISLNAGLNPGPGGSTDRYMVGGDMGRPDAPSGELGGLSYELFADAGMTQSWGEDLGETVAHVGTGAAVDLTVYGRVPAGQNVAATSYQDTVVATISF